MNGRVRVEARGSDIPARLKERRALKDWARRKSYASATAVAACTRDGAHMKTVWDPEYVHRLKDLHVIMLLHAAEQLPVSWTFK